MEMSYEKEIEFRQRQRKEMRAWLQNPKVRQWRRVLFLLRADGGPMPTADIAFTLRTAPCTVRRVLKKMRVSNCVKEIRERKKGKIALSWEITDRGEKEIRRAQKNKIIPDFVW